jgi:hypothetical protein
LGNFALLSSLDKRLFGGDINYISISTAVIWTLYLTSEKSCPQIVRIVSAAAIALSCALAPYLNMHFIEFYVYIAFGAIWSVLIINNGFHMISAAVKIFLLLISKEALGLLSSVLSNEGVLLVQGPTKDIAIGLYLYGLFLISLRSDRMCGNQFVVVICGSVVGRVLAALTDEPLVYLHSCAFTATLLQGLAHGITREQGTLQKLQNNKEQVSKLAYEYSHVVYFPNLLLQALHNAYAV